MADQIITPEFRAAFISIFKPTATQNADGTPGTPRFSVRACFHPETDISALKSAAEAAVVAKFGDKVPKSLRSPFRRNEELDNPVPGIGDDWVIMTFSAAADKRPGVVDSECQDIIDEAEVYSGAWYRAQVRAYGYDKAGNKGVAFGLQNIQKIRNDEPLGAGRMPAAKAFEPVGAASGASRTAGSMFD